jgi:hypothetical protein
MLSKEPLMRTRSPLPPLSRAGDVNEEPEIGFEESVPLDGPDPEGERMIEELGRERGRRNEDQRPPAGPDRERRQVPPSR